MSERENETRLTSPSMGEVAERSEAGGGVAPTVQEKSQMAPARAFRPNRSASTPPGRFAATLPIEGRVIPARGEKALWRILRHGELAALNWRKQAPFRQYTLDFVSHPARLVVEADGAQHSLPAQKAHDQKRTALLESEGYKVVRFWNNEILLNSDGVFRSILAIALESPARNRILRWKEERQTSPSMGETGGCQNAATQYETHSAPTSALKLTAQQAPFPAATRPPFPSREG